MENSALKNRIKINTLVVPGERKETFEAIVPIEGRRKPTRVVGDSLVNLAKAIAGEKIPKNTVFVIPLGEIHAQAIVKELQRIKKTKTGN